MASIHNLKARLQRLEEATPRGAGDVKMFLVRFVDPGEQPETELQSVTTRPGDGPIFREAGESERVFIDRAFATSGQIVLYEHSVKVLLEHKREAA